MQSVSCFSFASVIDPFLYSVNSRYRATRLKPVLAKGLLPVFMGAIVPSGWMGEFFVLGFYPIFELIRYISVAEFLERMDPLIVSVWTMGAFLKESVFLFVFCLCISQLFGLSNYRSIILPLTLLAIIGAIWVTKNTQDMHNFLVYTFPFTAFVTHNLIPRILMIVDSIRRRGKGT